MNYWRHCFTLTILLVLTSYVNAQEESKFFLQITSPNPETILIYVRYLPTVNREVMNTYIDAAREVIKITAKSYGWDKWLKIREDIHPAKQEQ